MPSVKVREKRHEMRKQITDSWLDKINFQAIHPINTRYESSLGDALNYASATFEVKQLKEFSQEYMPNLDLSDVPDWEFYFVGQLAWVMLKGGYIRNPQRDLDARLIALVEKYKTKTLKEIPVISIVDVKTRKIMEEFEAGCDIAVEECRVVSLYDTMTETQGRVHWDEIKQRVNSQLAEVMRCKSKNPEYADIVEAYAKHTPQQLKAYVMFLRGVLEDIERVSQNKKATRKPRKARVKKKVSADKVVKRIKYLATYPDLKLVSIAPEKLVGAQVLWVFNVKTRKLGKYVAADTMVGLSMKGTTILGYNEEQSIQKKVRKPEKLSEVATMGKVDLRRFFEDIRAVEQKMNGRINKDTVLLRV